ncbi:MAG: PAS domain S-box protein [Planctomycetes bacterium]|nr:PAS domain S-box protein [Planctomycetota bacterium]
MAGRKSTAQFRIVGLSGGRLWMETHSAPLRNARGEVTSVLSVTRDVTQRRWTEEALKRERDFMTAVLDTAGALVDVVDRRGRIVRFNRACEEASGYSFEEVRARPFWDIVLPPDEVEEARAWFRNIDSVRFPAEREGDWLNRDGTRRRISWSRGAISGPDGKIEFIVGTGIDITERRRVEECERERGARAYRHQSALLRLARIDVAEIGPALRKVTEIVSETLDVDRVGIWSFTEDRTHIVCDSQFVRSAGRHENGTRIEAKQYPAYFRSLEESRTIAAEDAQSDPRTSEFRDGYLVPFGITSMMDVPIRRHGTVAGIVCFEHTGPRRAWSVEEQDFGGSAADLISLVWETAERRRAEEALRDREARIQVMIEHLPGILWSVDAGGRITSSMGTGVSALGLSNNQLVGMTLEDYVQSRDPRHPALDAARRALAGESVTYEMEFQGRSFENHVQPLRDREGRVYACVGLSFDVSDRKRVEREHREREARLRLLVEQMPGVLWSTDSDLRFTSSVGSGLGALGLLPNQVVGMSLHDYFQTKDPNYPSIAAHRRALAGHSVTFESDWKGRTFQTHVEPLRDPSGRITACLGLALDVTERKKAEEDIRRLNEDLERRVAERTAALEEANKELEAFSYSVSHDLRAPVRAIDGFAGILSEEFAATLGTEGMRLLGIVRKNTSHMGQLIDDLLSFARLSRKEVEASDIDMSDLARSVLDDLRKVDPERRVEVALDPLQPAKGDRPMMRQVFANLLANAWKFTRRRKYPTVRISCRTEPREVIYSVADNGVGFDMQYVHKLFGVFQRLHSPEEFEGTGVGLAIVQRIVKRHRGRVWAEGALDGGATFHFALPRGEEAS